MWLINYHYTDKRMTSLDVVAETNDPQNSRVIIFSNYRESVR